MDDRKLGIVESRFADLIWENEPIASGNLVTLCQKQLDWKKSTTYTVLKKLCQREIFQNENGVVTSRISRDNFYAMQSKQFVEETFQGSLPAFIAAFTSQKALSQKEIDEILQMIGTERRDS